MNLPDVRSLSSPQILVAALLVTAVVGLAFASRRRSTGSGVGVAVWLMIPLVLAIGALGVWTLIKTLDFMGPGY